jgi:ABC-type oligopeptide transport system substrate-binding subunit
MAAATSAATEAATTAAATTETSAAMTSTTAAVTATSAGAATSTSNGPVLRVGASVFPDSLDPQAESFSNEIPYTQLAYEGLTRLDKDLKTVPGAAESWQYNSDDTAITFTLPLA